MEDATFVYACALSIFIGFVLWMLYIVKTSSKPEPKELPEPSSEEKISAWEKRY